MIRGVYLQAQAVVPVLKEPFFCSFLLQEASTALSQSGTLLAVFQRYYSALGVSHQIGPGCGPKSAFPK